MVPELHPLMSVKSAVLNTVLDCFHSCNVILVCCGGLFPATVMWLFASRSARPWLTLLSMSSPRFMLQEAWVRLQLTWPKLERSRPQSWPIWEVKGKLSAAAVGVFCHQVGPPSCSRKEYGGKNISGHNRMGSCQKLYCKSGNYFPLVFLSVQV